MFGDKMGVSRLLLASRVAPKNTRGPPVFIPCTSRGLLWASRVPPVVRPCPSVVLQWAAFGGRMMGGSWGICWGLLGSSLIQPRKTIFILVTPFSFREPPIVRPWSYHGLPRESRVPPVVRPWPPVILP